MKDKFSLLAAEVWGLLGVQILETDTPGFRSGSLPDYGVAFQQASLEMEMEMEMKLIWGNCGNEITQCASRAWYNQPLRQGPFITRSCLHLFTFPEMPHICSRWPKSMRACILNYEKCINIYNMLSQINQLILHLDLGRNSGMVLYCAIILSCVNFVPSFWL